jgi:hypothetical protein
VLEEKERDQIAVRNSSPVRQKSKIAGGGRETLVARSEKVYKSNLIGKKKICMILLVHQLITLHALRQQSFFFRENLRQQSLQRMAVRESLEAPLICASARLYRSPQRMANGPSPT